MREDTKEKILTTAYTLFALKGFESCSMNDIAKEANVNKASLYYHFPNKEGLYEEVIKGILESFYMRVSSAVSQESTPHAKLYAFIYAFGENFTDNRHMAPLMLRELASNGANLSVDVKAILLRNMTLLQSILELGKTQGLFRDSPVFVVYLTIVGTMNMYTATSKLRKNMRAKSTIGGFDLGAKELANEIMQLLLAGLSVKESI